MGKKSYILPLVVVLLIGCLASFVLAEPPVNTSGFDGATTNFSEVNVSEVDQPVLESVGNLNIAWDGEGLNFSGADLATYITYGEGWVNVESANLPSGINTSANVTLYGL